MTRLEFDHDYYLEMEDPKEEIKQLSDEAIRQWITGYLYGDLGKYDESLAKKTSKQSKDILAFIRKYGLK